MKSTWFKDKRGYELMKLLAAGHSELRLQTVFRDWVRVCSLTLLQKANQFAGGFCTKTEDEILDIQRRYPKWKETFAPAFAMLITTYQDIVRTGEVEDFIGNVYQEMGANSKWHGQFFTPMHICRVMASLTLGTKDEFETAFQSKPRRLRFMEPACGAGATLLGAWEQLMRWEVPLSAVYFLGIDLDPMCVDMAYIQLSLYGVPATIYNADTLRNPTCKDAPAYTTIAGRMFPLIGKDDGSQIVLANPPFGGIINTDDMPWLKQKPTAKKKVPTSVSTKTESKPTSPPRVIRSR